MNLNIFRITRSLKNDGSWRTLWLLQYLFESQSHVNVCKYYVSDTLAVWHFVSNAIWSFFNYLTRVNYRGSFQRDVSVTGNKLDSEGAIVYIYICIRVHVCIICVSYVRSSSIDPSMLVVYYRVFVNDSRKSRGGSKEEEEERLERSCEGEGQLARWHEFTDKEEETSVDECGAERLHSALDRWPRPRVSYRLLPLKVDVLRGAKVPRERHAIEELAELALVHRHVVEESEQEPEETYDEDQTHPDDKDLAPAVVVAE